MADAGGKEPQIPGSAGTGGLSSMVRRSQKSGGAAPQMASSSIGSAGSQSQPQAGIIAGRSPSLQVRNVLTRTLGACSSRLRRHSQPLTFALTAAVVIFGISQISDFLQKSLMYYPRRYDGRTHLLTKEMGVALARHNYKLEEVEYSFSSSWFGSPLSQRAFLVMPSQQSSIGALWVVYGGNAMLATDWFEFIIDVMQHTQEQKAKIAPSKSAFLLMDFPGYGINDGSPSTESTLYSAEAGVEEAVRILNTSNMVPQELRYLGHSLGGGAVTQLAAHLAEKRPSWLQETRPVGRLLLSATFTSIMPDMGKVLFAQLPGASSLIWAVGLTSRHRWDSYQKLKSLIKATKADPPGVAIMHGQGDEIVPVTLGERIYELCKEEGLESCCFIKHPWAHHNDLLDQASRTYLELICEEDGLSRQLKA